MLSLDTSSLYGIVKDHGLTEEELNSQTGKIPEFLKKIEARNQGFYKLPDQSTDRINDFANQADLKHIVVCGIGGSALGTICLQQSLTPLFEPSKLHILDNIDPTLLSQIDDLIDYEKTLFIIITKSGTTMETMSQYRYFREKIATIGLDPQKHFTFVTDPEKGELRKIAVEEGITAFDIPENVGGRFSVLTPVGLLPAALIGIDIEKLLKGARTQRDKSLSKNDNPAFTLAAIQYLLSQKGKNITVMMPYCQRLIRLADWYSQLLAESIGKSEEAGLTPISALGVTDQHSQLQLYNDGPNDKLIIFIEVENLGAKLQIPGGPTFNELMQIEKRATQESLTKNNRPNITIKLDSVNEQSLGELFMFLEGSIAFLGEFFQIDAFNQPGVELSKQLTKKYAAELT